MTLKAIDPKKSSSKSNASEVASLKRDDWLDEAYRAVVEGGFENVKVLSLADKLKVTRGSFYWHFADHADLVSSLIKRWQETQIALNASVMAIQTKDPLKDLDAVVETAFLQAGTQLENLRFEQALRAFGHHHTEAAHLLIEVDEARMAMLQAKFKAVVKVDKKARDLAALLYLAIAGSYQALSRPINPPNIQAYLRSLISHYLVQQQIS
jgi:AcrR family transcriptional regulator